MQEREQQATASRAEVENFEGRVAVVDAGQRRLDDRLRFRTGNQCPRRYVERQAPKLSLAHEIRHGLPASAARNQGFEMAENGVRAGVVLEAAPLRVFEKKSGFQPRLGDAGATQAPNRDGEGVVECGPGAAHGAAMRAA